MHIIHIILAISCVFLIMGLLRMRKKFSQEDKLLGVLFLILAFGLAVIAFRAWLDYKREYPDHKPRVMRGFFLLVFVEIKKRRATEGRPPDPPEG